jgi:hypothetical protein
LFTRPAVSVASGIATWLSCNEAEVSNRLMGLSPVEKEPRRLDRQVTMSLAEHPSRALRCRKDVKPARRQPIIDSQTARGVQKGGFARSFRLRRGKKVKGRHILVDRLGHLLSVVVHPADVQDRDGAFHFAARRMFPFIERIFADRGCAGQKMALVVWRTGAWKIANREAIAPGFEVSRNRRLARDFERDATTVTALVPIAMIRNHAQAARCKGYFTEALARMFDPDRKNRTAGRIIDLWDGRRARGPSRYSIRRSAARSVRAVPGSHAIVRVAVSSARLIYARSTAIPTRRSKA